MLLAIQEKCLPGHETGARLRFAASAGLDGVEFDAAGLDTRIGDVIHVLKDHDLRASGVFLGGTHLLHPQMLDRTGAIRALQLAMTCALDLDGTGVTFFATLPETPRLPNLMPYKDSLELEIELLITQLRTTLADFAYATGAMLHLGAQTHAETHLLHRLDMIATILHHIHDHPHVKMAADTAVMACEEADMLQTLANYAGRLGVIYLRGTGGALPAEGNGVDYAAVLDTLRAAGYDGWLVLAGHGFEDEIRSAAAYIRALL
ncbi:MAG: sugar phosphate isomerase/epimerase family protein [Phototrophicaceae bacterium]